MRTSHLACSVVLLLANACSYSYEYKYDLRVTRDVTLPPGVEIVLGDTVLDHDIVSESFDTHDVIETQPDQTRYRGKAYANDPDLHAFAFVDLDGDGEWDENEPWGEDPNGVVDVEDNESYASVIVIENP